MITGKHFIGENLSAEGTSVFESINPKNREKNGEFYNATLQDVNAAADKAAAAFLSYSSLSAKKRATFLDQIGEEIMNLGEELIQIYCAESGLPEGRAQGERERTVNQLKSFANYISKEDWKTEFKDLGNAQRKPLPKPSLFKTSVAIGPVVVFGASNCWIQGCNATKRS